jgi:hypothetical protein
MTLPYPFAVFFIHLNLTFLIAYYLSAFKMKLENVKVNVELEGLKLRSALLIFSSAVI